MTVRTPAKEIRELEADTEELEQESEASDAEESDNEEEMASDNESDEEEMANDNDSDEDDNEFDDNESEGDDEADNDDEGNAGWADAFAKVLQQEKPKNKKYLVLSKATKLADKKDKDDADKKVTFEIDGKGDDDDDEDGDVKPELNEEDAKPTSNELELALIARKERSNKLLQLRVKPSAMDRERERALKRISTKGVVQLFNAVRSQQRDLVHRLEKAGPLDHRRDEVLNNVNKRQFLDMLMGGKRAKSENVDNPIKDEKEDGSKPSQWSVLRDDFMTNKKLKHWDEDEGSDNQAVDNNDMDSDSD